MKIRKENLNILRVINHAFTFGHERVDSFKLV